MCFLSSLLSCFGNSSSRISETSHAQKGMKVKNKEKSPRPPIPVSYFPVNSQLSRL
ncbi:hypothetical protein F511_07653 [Dorcoceras hygrometricum]|uniref:Uncharacterized protein n=1 Tax=Dorcoceras hygrometricum TaxID=472368 RepID=A0A2Z7CJF2_9LAMI|nr:hypothetical protein F511_07653 [Dorcoceras hygrometricum]